MLSVLSHYSGDDGDCAVKPERQNSTGNMLKRLGSSKRLSGVPARRADYEDYDDGEKVSDLGIEHQSHIAGLAAAAAAAMV